MRTLALLGVLALPALAACERREASSGSDGLVTRAIASQSSPERQSALDSSRRTALVDAAARVGPGVVSITATTRRRVQSQSFFDFFYGPTDREQVVPVGGTGFIVRPDGIIITNQHVVAGAVKVVVTLRDGTDLPARVLGEDPTTDIAVVKVDRTDLPVVPLGRSTDLMIGEWVVALGNPFAYLLGNTEPSVTAGVVSAVGRNILPGQDQTGLYLDMIQTDASINPGNSGGPLANALGEVIGVNSSIFSQSGGSIGLGFAIPIERALRVADEIVRTGEVRRAWVGIEVAGANRMQDWKTQGGVVVVRVADGGPAWRAGIRPNDVLMQANGRRLRNFLDWEAAKLDLRVGDSLRIHLREGNRELDRVLISSDLPTVTAEKVNVLKGMELVTVTPAVQSERGLSSSQGALIFGISPQIARATGLAEGDVILAINRTRITRAEQVSEIFNALRPREAVRVYIERGGQPAFTDLVFR